MRIGYVGNFTRPWCTETHVSASLEELGHELFRFQENSVQWRQLPQLCKRRGVELLLWTRTWEVDRLSAENAVKQLRADGIPTVSYHLDRFHGLEREPLIESEPFFKTDLLVTPDDGPWARYGVRHKWLPPGVFGPETGRVQPNRRRWPWDVVFVGSHPYPHVEWQPVRGRMIDLFRREFGERFAVLPAEQTRGRVRPLRGRDLQELYATVPVVVGDSCLAGDPYRYWSDRIPETIGRGAALIHPTVRGMAGWYSPGSDFLTYDVGVPAQAVEQARTLLEDLELRREVAAHGRVTALNQDLYTHRMATVLDWVRNGFHLDPLELAPVERVEVEDGLYARVESPHAEFELIDGLGDLHAVSEVWRGDYPITPELVSGQIVVDIGANVGAFSVLAALMGARKVLAFEPHPETYRVLCRNIKLNGVERIVYPVRAAVVATAGGDVALAGDSTACHVARLGEGTDSWAPTVGADDAVPADAHVVKMDCEGGEYDIIEGLTHWPGHLFLEWHGPTMPHLPHAQSSRWSTMVTQLAERGRVTTVGHPSRGGLLTWSRY